MSPAVPTRRRPLSTESAALAIALAAACGGWLVAVCTAVGQTLTDPSVVEDRACGDVVALRRSDARAARAPAAARPCPRTP